MFQHPPIKPHKVTLGSVKTCYTESLIAFQIKCGIKYRKGSSSFVYCGIFGVTFFFLNWQMFRCWESLAEGYGLDIETYPDTIPASNSSSMISFIYFWPNKKDLIILFRGIDSMVLWKFLSTSGYRRNIFSLPMYAQLFFFI